MRLSPFNAPLILLAACVFILAGLEGILTVVRVFNAVHGYMAGV